MDKSPESQGSFGQQSPPTEANQLDLTPTTQSHSHCLWPHIDSIDTPQHMTMRAALKVPEMPGTSHRPGAKLSQFNQHMWMQRRAESKASCRLAKAETLSQSHKLGHLRHEGNFEQPGGPGSADWAQGERSVPDWQFNYHLGCRADKPSHSQNRDGAACSESFCWAVGRPCVSGRMREIATAHQLAS